MTSAIINTQQLFQRRQIQSEFNHFIQESLQVNLPFVKRLGLQNELQGHTGCVNCLQWSDCGEYLASGSDDYNIIFWDMVTQQQKSIIQTGHEGNIFAVKFMPASNNSIIASGAADSVIKIHDIEAGKTLHSFSCHMRRVKKLAVSGHSPFLLWSASEDGSIREFDLRLPHSCSTQCNNVLIDLRSHSGQTKEAMCVQIHPFFSERIVVGAADPFIRLYDRRKLSLSDYKSSMQEREGIASGGCISYFSPGHLSNRKNRKRPQKFRHYTTTHVTFSPNGEEILQYLGGEHIFLYDLNEQRKPLLFSSTGNCSHENDDKINIRHTRKNGVNKNINGTRNGILSSTYEMRNGQNQPLVNDPSNNNDELNDKAMKWKRKGNDFFSKQDYFQAVVCYNNALKLSPNSSVLYANRGAALLKRAWDGDLYAALRDCQVSVQLDPTHSKAYYRQAKCLFELKWYEEANVCLQLFKEMFPDQTDGYTFKKFEAELNSQVKDNNENGEGEGSQSSDSDFGSSQRNPSREESYRQYNASDYNLRFVGACNTTTDIKEANYFGEKGQYIIAGSDCGCMLLWDRSTTNLIEAWQGDESIVNCVQPHPTTCLVATSGLDPVVRLWNPRPLNSNDVDGRAKEVEVLARTNQKRMNTDPLEEMLRSMGYRSVEGESGEGEEEGEDGSPMQCRTS